MQVKMQVLIFRSAIIFQRPEGALHVRLREAVGFYLPAGNCKSWDSPYSFPFKVRVEAHEIMSDTPLTATYGKARIRLTGVVKYEAIFSIEFPTPSLFQKNTLTGLLNQLFLRKCSIYLHLRP